MSTTHLWALIQEWLDAQFFRVTQAQLAEKLGVRRSALSQWKLGKARPTPEHLRELHRVTRIDYDRLLEALVRDMGYLDAEDGEPNDTPPMSQAGGRPAIGSGDTGSGPGGRGGGAAQAGPASLEGSEPRRGGIQRGSLPRRRPTRGRPRPQDTPDGTTDISD